jgi:hypothetical protein
MCTAEQMAKRSIRKAPMCSTAPNWNGFMDSLETIPNFYIRQNGAIDVVKEEYQDESQPLCQFIFGQTLK